MTPHQGLGSYLVVAMVGIAMVGMFGWVCWAIWQEVGPLLGCLLVYCLDPIERARVRSNRLYQRTYRQNAQYAAQVRAETTAQMRVMAEQALKADRALFEKWWNSGVK